MTPEPKSAEVLTEENGVARYRCVSDVQSENAPLAMVGAVGIPTFTSASLPAKAKRSICVTDGILSEAMLHSLKADRPIEVALGSDTDAIEQL